MAYLILSQHGQEEQWHSITKRLWTVGESFTHDVCVHEGKGALLFSILQKGVGDFELHPQEVRRLKVNGQPVSRSHPLRSCDRLEWDQGTALFFAGELPTLSTPSQKAQRQSLQFLQGMNAQLERPRGVTEALRSLLTYVSELAGAESARLLSETQDGAGWDIVATYSSQPEAGTVAVRELVSNTILSEAIQSGKPVYVESLVGHPWGQAASVMAAGVYSAACLPLILDGHVFGALYLFTRTPGKSLERKAFEEIELVTSQAALVLMTHQRLEGLEVENTLLREKQKNARSTASPARNGLFGRSAAMLQLEERLTKVAETPLNLLIVGETGVGKEVVARTVHERSARAAGPFVAINCAAIPEALLESTLFGHERGAFTGAVRSHIGKFQQAHQGTLLLDEIADMPLALQAKLLRVLQEKQIEPVGSTRSRAVDVRVLAATHKNLQELVARGQFRQDLYYRLHGAVLEIPPLRERREDILYFAQKFLKRLAPELRWSPESEQALLQADWPGNIRELEQSVLRASALCRAGVIEAADLELNAAPRVGSLGWKEGEDLKEAQRKFTQEYVQNVLQQNAGSRTAAAARLGISERSLYRILAEASEGMVAKDV